MEQKMDIHVIRLKPKQDLKVALQEFVTHKNMQAAWIISCAGSLANYNLRFANNKNSNAGKGFFEIISLSGTLSVHGCHLHIAIGDSNGALIGGHLLDGCIIYTTAEIIIGESRDLIFIREHDNITGFSELQIRKIE